MEVLPVDVAQVVAIVFGTSIVLIPVLGLTLRFAVKPLFEAYARAFPAPARQAQELERLERRVRELEEALADQRGERLALPPARLNGAAAAVEP